MHINKHLTAFLTLFVILCFLAIESNAQVLTGTIRDSKTNETLIGATIGIKGTNIGGVTDINGKFSIQVGQDAPFTVVVLYLGYQSQDVKVTSLATPLTIKLVSDEFVIKEVEIVGSRISEKQKEAPLTIESMDIIAIKETPAANFYEGLGQLKGVDLTSASMGFKVINTRGFNSTSPVRSLQIIDGVDNQAPGLNFSLGNFLGASELDILKVDLVVGASSAFYGPNAFNGVISMQTKSPFYHEGLSVMTKAGERGLLESAIRYAHVFQNKNGIDKFAYKLNLYFMRANDWEADNMDPTPQSTVGRSNPGGYDAVNRYGDENLTRGINNATSLNQQVGNPGLGRWHRTGYMESDLVDYNSRNLKAAGTFVYRIKPDVELTYASSFGTGTTVYQGDNRYSLKDILFFQNRIELAKPGKSFIRAYATHEDAGNSYDAVFTAFLLQGQVKSDANWSRDYRNYWSQKIAAKVRNLPGYPTFTFGQPFNFDQANAVLALYSDSLLLWHSQASTVANGTNIQGDKGYLVPGTAAFDSAFASITSRTVFGEGGSKFYDKSALYHVHAENKFSKLKFGNIDKDLGLEVTTGANYRLYAPNSQGTIFSDTSGRKITNSEFGAYLGLEKKFVSDKLKINLTGRLDKNENFDFIVSPAASAVYSINKDNVFRLSFSSAIRNPTLADQYLYYNVGRAILLGNVNGKDSIATVESLIDYFDSATLDPSKLVYFTADPIRPEKVKSVEVGYRTTFLKNIFFDASYYFSFYTDFIGYKLGAGDIVFDPATPNFISKLQFYRIAANAADLVTTQGFSAGLNYYFKKFYGLSGNYSWNELNKQGSEDPIIPAFNTPRNKYNIGFNGREIDSYFTLLNFISDKLSFPVKNIGFSINYKWVQGFDYEGSPQFTGYVPSYDMVDLQVNKKVPAINTTFKVGASNVLNNMKYQVYGGPAIGRLAYFSVLVDLEAKK